MDVEASACTEQCRIQFPFGVVVAFSRDCGRWCILRIFVLVSFGKNDVMFGSRLLILLFSCAPLVCGIIGLSVVRAVPGVWYGWMCLYMLRVRVLISFRHGKHYASDKDLIQFFPACPMVCGFRLVCGMGGCRWCIVRLKSCWCIFAWMCWYADTFCVSLRWVFWQQTMSHSIRLCVMFSRVKSPNGFA